MIIKQNSGNEKILVALIESTKSLTVKLLAEKTGIAYKNIHRNLTKLSNNEYINKDIVQDGRNRYTYISLTPKGSDFKTNQPIETPKKERKLFGITESKSLPKFDNIEYEKTKFGIRFYAWLGRELGIGNYYNERLPMLKLKIGLELIKQSKLVISGKPLNKYFDEVK